VAVHKRVYRPYEGPLTAERWRFLVVSRYGLQELVESRVLVAFVVMCLIPFLVEAAGIYIANSPAARALLQVGGLPHQMKTEFFAAALVIQGTLAFLLTAWVAPVLVSPDLVNGALPLYLSRAFSRADYVLGKAVVMLSVLSLITWVPGLTLFVLQAGLAEPSWIGANLRVAGAIFAGAWIWITVLTLLGLALSASIRWRLVASGALFGVFFMGSAFGEAWHRVLRDPWGRAANLAYVVGLVWRDLFGIVMPGEPTVDVPTWAAALALASTCALSVWLLHFRLRAREVVS
jgi:ABC-2 type transport system permease protein